MNTLWYSDYKLPVRDCKALELAQQLSDSDIATSNALVVLEARVLFKKGIIPKFRIMFDDEEVEMDDDAGIPFWPVGFCDRQDELFRVLFGF